MKKQIIRLLICFGISVNTTAQGQWDLQHCISYALTHNIQLKQTALNNETNKNNTDQVKANILPSLNANATHQYNVGQTIDRFTNSFARGTVLSQNFFLSSNVILWSGMSQYHTIKANEYNYLSGVELLKQQENDLSLNVANAYIGVIFADEVLKISQNQFTITKEQLERTQKLVNAGALAKSIEYDIKAQLANEELNVTTAENNYYLNLLTLRQLMNLDSVPNFSVTRPEINMQEDVLLENNMAAMYETALKSQPSVKSAEYGIKSAEKFLAASRGRISPTLSFNASIGTGISGQAVKQSGDSVNSVIPLGFYQGVPLTITRREPVYVDMPFSEQFKNNSNKVFGFTLSIPLFNGLQTHTAIKNAKINAYNAKLSQDLTKQNLYKNIAQAYANAKASFNKFNATKSSVEAATESFKYAQQKFNAGVISAFDFNTAKNRLYAAESNLLQSKYDYVFKLKVLDYYQGKPLRF